MEYTVPTTKQEMYASLQNIYAHYRLNRTIYEPVILSELDIDEIEYTPLSDQELREKAEGLLLGEQKMKLCDAKKNLQEKVREIDQKILLSLTTYQSKVDSIEEEYSAKIKELKTEADKKGLGRSNVSFSVMSEILKEKEIKLEKVLEEKSKKEEGYLSVKNSYLEEIENLEDSYADAFESEIEAKFLELKDRQFEKLLQVEKYNNGVKERKIQVSNNNLVSQANIDIKRIDSQSHPLTKEQLVDLGYYTDAMNCIYDYYSTLPPLEAYHDILDETSLMIYLDDFYTTAISLYRIRTEM